MIDEKRVKLMTKLAIYESREENRDMVMSRYYKSDYVRYHCLKTVITSTICYWVIVAAVVMLKFQDILNQINELDYLRLIYLLMIGFVAFDFIYVILAFVIYNVRYSMAKPGLLSYNKNLKKLIELDAGEPEDDNPGIIKVSSNIGGDFDDDFEDAGKGSIK